jgi:NAD(P)-dependent dehydrogenase (short-subunit alcohol dehydrogenase family)
MNMPPQNSRVCVVTGVTGMLGRATAIDLASRGAHLVLLCRDRSRGERVLAEVKNTGPRGSHWLVVGDLSDPVSVRSLAAQIRAETPDIHALIHTAAIFTRQRQENRAGHELMFATNVLGRFLLTHELLRELKRGIPSRVLIATGPSPDRLDFENLLAHKNFQPFMQFRATNAANLHFAFELARRLDGSGVISNAYHPGALQSNLMKEMPAVVRWITLPFGRSADKAAHALGALALDHTYAQESGRFYNFEKPIKPPKNSEDIHAQQRLWEESERLLGIE